eukprot:3019258-Pleurochrysis_carterae.AAC.1
MCLCVPHCDSRNAAVKLPPEWTIPFMVMIATICVSDYTFVVNTTPRISLKVCRNPYSSAYRYINIGKCGMESQADNSFLHSVFNFNTETK